MLVDKCTGKRRERDSLILCPAYLGEVGQCYLPATYVLAFWTEGIRRVANILSNPGSGVIMPFLRCGNSLRVNERTQVRTKAESRIKPEYFSLPGLCHSSEGTDPPSKLLEKFEFIVDIWLYPGRWTAHFNPQMTLLFFQLISSGICQK